MTSPKRQMHLGLFVLGTGNHSAGWRYHQASSSNSNWAVIRSLAELAERAKFDLFFISDGLAMEPGDHPSFVSRFEPLTLIAALGAVTTHVGLGATVSTSFNEPFHIARALASVDHISGGRSAWNVVTSNTEKSALNFSRERLNEHDLRYEIANEFVDVVKGLWDTWDENAIVADKVTGDFLDRTKVRELNHKGRFFSARGPLNIERPPQGHPLIIQAGGSEPGLELSARTADLVFSVVQDPAAAKRGYQQLKARVAKHGRDPNTVTIMPGVMPIVGDSDQEARDKLNLLQSWLSSTNALTLVSQRIGHDISGFPLDGPIPEFPMTQKSQSFSKVLLDMARRENMTLRELYNVTAAARGHGVIYGTPKKIADDLEYWFTSGMADGFIVMPPYFPGAFTDFIEKVVPELQKRGLFRREYSGSTFREHLGITKPTTRSMNVSQPAVS